MFGTFFCATRYFPQINTDLNPGTARAERTVRTYGYSAYRAEGSSCSVCMCAVTARIVHSSQKTLTIE